MARAAGIFTLILCEVEPDSAGLIGVNAAIEDFSIGNKDDGYSAGWSFY